MATTVVIPTYNHGHWLADSISSAMEQADEVVVVDDGSTDDTRDVVRAFPVRYCRLPKAGLAAARNTGLYLTATELVCFLDADDILPVDFIGRLGEALCGHADEVAFAYSGIQFVGDDHRHFPPEQWSLPLLKERNYVSATSLFRRRAIAPARFDSALNGWEDWDFVLSLVGHGFRGVPAECSFQYRKHWDEPSLFDKLSQRPINLAVARRYLAYKHRTLYDGRDRLKAEVRVQAARLHDIGLRIQRSQRTQWMR